jgi:hypothetical protein
MFVSEKYLIISDKFLKNETGLKLLNLLFFVILSAAKNLLQLIKDPSHRSGRQDQTI